MDKNRQTFIGGSDAAAVLGLSRWTTPLQLWAQKTGQWQKPDGDELYKRLGRRLEEVVSELFTQKTGKKVQRANEHRIHPKFPFLCAQIDRLVIGGDAVLECKTASGWKAKEWDGEEIPREYIIQVMHQMAVTGKKKGYIAVLIGNQDFKVKEIERDEKVIADMVAKEVMFWNCFVVPKVMPTQITEKDDDVLYGLYPVAAPGSEIELDDKANQMIESRNALIQDKILVEGQIDQIENELKALLKDKEIGETATWKVVWKEQVQSRCDTAKLKETLPAIYASMLKEIRFRKLTIRGKNK